MVRRLALVTAIAMVAALPLPMWNATRNLVTRPSLPAVVWIAVAIAYVFSTILPLFYFALWRSGDFGVSKQLRWICLPGVLSGLIVVWMRLPVTTLTTLLSMLATLSCMVLLMAMFLRPGAMEQRSTFLRSITWVAVSGGVLWFAINVLTFASNPNAGPLGTVFEQVCLFTAPVLVAATGRIR